MQAQTITGNPLKQVLNFGQSIWYDGLISAAEFKKLIQEDGVRGATTNPAIFEKAVSSGQYDTLIKGSDASHTAEEIFKTIAITTVREVCDQFMPIYQSTNGLDGFVSIEVNPLLANSFHRTVEEAQELWKRVDRKNAMIKVPATRAGVKAVEELILQGINVNATLIFSIERYSQVMNAYLSGLDNRAIERKTISGISSVASFFVSRVDTAVDPLLEKTPAVKDLKGKIAVANSQAAYREFLSVFSSARYRKLEIFGAQIQRPLWASTGTKNPQYSDVLYVETLIGPNTVNTMPPSTLAAFRDHGHPADRIREGADQAVAMLERLEESGIHLSQITEDLEKAGVQSFADAHHQIIEAIERKRK